MTRFGRTAASFYRWVTLPFARYKLNRLSQELSSRPRPFKLSTMSFDEAAQPTAQQDIDTSPCQTSS